MVPHFAEVRLPAKQLKQFSTTRLHFIDVTLDFFPLVSSLLYTARMQYNIGTGRWWYSRSPLPNTNYYVFNNIRGLIKQLTTKTIEAPRSLETSFEIGQTFVYCALTYIFNTFCFFKN